MKASELVEKLQKLIEEYGDLDITVPDGDTTFGTEDLQETHLLIDGNNILIG